LCRICGKDDRWRAVSDPYLRVLVAAGRPIRRPGPSSSRAYAWRLVGANFPASGRRPFIEFPTRARRAVLDNDPGRFQSVPDRVGLGEITLLTRLGTLVEQHRDE